MVAEATYGVHGKWVLFCTFVVKRSPNGKKGSVENLLRAPPDLYKALRTNRLQTYRISGERWQLVC